MRPTTPHPHSRRASRAVPPLGGFVCVVILWIVATPFSGRATEPDSPALIRRDTYGVPHILASSERDAAFAHGYATAEDHLATLAPLFLRARGEKASVFGEASLREDVLVHQLGIWDTAQAKFETLPPHIQAILNGYAEGYNAYLATHRTPALEWAKPVTGIDVLAHCRAVLLMEFSLDLGAWRDVKLPAGTGSNMWAVGRGRSASGHGLLLANPHVNWTGSQTFQEVHLRVPGRIDISGATLIGFPVVTLGFNETLGWSHTVNQPRSDSVYALTLDPERPMTYTFDGLTLPIKSRTVSLRVRTKQGEEVRTQTLLSSHLGPIIRIDGDTAYAFRSPNLDLVDFITQYNVMAKARTFDEFRAALHMQQLPMFNIGYADRAGNILYLFNGRIPIRPAAAGSETVLRGDTSATQWYAVHPVADLPQLINPPGGYIQNTNNAPWYTTTRPMPDRGRYAAYIGGDGLGQRGQLSLQLLERTAKVTLDTMMRLKNDETMGSPKWVKADLIRLAKTRKPRAADLEAAARVLQTWDDRASIDSRGAVLFVRWWEDYRGKAKPVFKQPWNGKQPLTTPSGVGDPAMAIAALQRTIAALTKDYGSVSVPWGDVHRIRRGGQELPIGGNGDAVRTMWYRTDGTRRIANGGDGYVLAVEFTPTPTAYSVLAYSASADPASPHHNDQLALFAEKRYKRVWFSEQDIQQHLERAYRPGQLPAAAAASQASRQ
jgi:acyl-homoserine-lactone acylase